MSELLQNVGLSDIDPRLVEEAFRRACRARENHEPAIVLARIIAEAKRGTRDLHGLVGAAARSSLAA